MASSGFLKSHVLYAAIFHLPERVALHHVSILVNVRSRSGNPRNSSLQGFGAVSSLTLCQPRVGLASQKCDSKDFDLATRDQPQMMLNTTATAKHMLSK